MTEVGVGRAFPASQKGHTQTQLEKSERTKGERSLKYTTPLTPRQVALKLGSAWASQAQLQEPSAQVQICLANSVLSDPWQVTWLRLLVCTEVAMRINEVGRAKCCEHLPPLAVGGVPGTTPKQTEPARRCQGCFSQGLPFLNPISEAPHPTPEHLSLFQSQALKLLSRQGKNSHLWEKQAR